MPEKPQQEIAREKTEVRPYKTIQLDASNIQIFTIVTRKQITIKKGMQQEPLFR